MQRMHNTRQLVSILTFALGCLLGGAQASAQMNEEKPLKFEIHRPLVYPMKTHVAMGNAASLVLKGSDSLDSLHPLEFRIMDVPEHGTLTEIESAGPFSAKVVYTPNRGFRGKDGFTYTASDGLFTSLSQTVNIFVLGPGDDPTTFDTDSRGIRSQDKPQKPGVVEYKDPGFAVFDAVNWSVQTQLRVGFDTPGSVDPVEIRGTNAFLRIRETSGTDTAGINLVTNGNSFGSLYITAGGDLRASVTAGGEKLSLRQTDGFFGVGTSAPFQQLTVGGTIGFKNGTAPMLQLGESGTTGNNRMIVSHTPGLPSFGIFYDDAADIMRWQQTGASDTMFSVDLGNRRVGVNTAAPAADLHISQLSAATNPQVRISANGSLPNRFPHLLFYDTNTNTAMGQLVSDVQFGRFVFDYNSAVGGDFTVRKVLNSNSPADVVLFSNAAGNIGLGTGSLQAGARVTINGNVHIIGNVTKTGVGELVRIDDGDREIEYSVSIGPEIGTYVRGSARLENGEALIELPDHFTATTAEEGLTVQLTLMDECNGLRVVEKSARRILVRELARGDSNARFDYLVQGLRKGQENHRVIHPR